MKRLPLTDPGVPDHRSAARYLLWLIRGQANTVAMGIALGVVWMAAVALVPVVVGRAVDAVAAKDLDALARWVAAFAALGAVHTAAGITRHRYAVTNWLGAAYRTVQHIVDQSARLGATLPRRVATGEVVSIGTSDINHIGAAIDITARGTGAVVAIAVTAVILLHSSVPLGLAVLTGVPLLMGVVALLLRPLHRRQQAYRDLSGKLTTRASDIVAGLRVLRGVGGEAAFAGRYRAESARLRAAGVRVARVESLFDGAGVLGPGVAITLATWLGARFALAGEITVGELVAFYGYAVFLTAPLRTLVEAADKLTRGHVAARRVVRILALEPEISDLPHGVSAPPVSGDLVDPDSGLVVRPGVLTALAAADPADAVSIVERLGRYVPDTGARLSGVPLNAFALATVRELILVADNDARLFRGRLRDELDSRATANGAALPAALHTACVADVVEALPAGLDTGIAGRGLEFSGGQLQRLRLARALAADAPILILVEPTNAVDAHTEARIAERLGPARAGRTTVVCTTSPLLLDRADHVAYVERGTVVAEGTHGQLLDTEPAYASTVTRGEES
jgi:ABC-type multidrug transport system fused ATPase/permease subunit